MITVKERYYALKKQTDKYFEDCQDPIHDYVTELEQELHDSELRRKDLLTSLQRANAQKAELEQENKQMLELLIEYLKSDFENGTDNLTVKNQELIQSVTGKKIEEVLK